MVGCWINYSWIFIEQIYKHGHCVALHEQFQRRMNQLVYKETEFSSFLLLLTSNPSNPAQLPWQSDPVQLVFWYCKVLKASCCCDLTAVAVPSQVAAFLRESFQIKTFSQKTLKLCCRRALNKRGASFRFHTSLWGKCLAGAQPCAARVCNDVSAANRAAFLQLNVG